MKSAIVTFTFPRDYALAARGARTIFTHDNPYRR